MSNRSGRSGRSWYRLSSIVRPTPYSSRDPSPPRHVIDTSFPPRHVNNTPPHHHHVVDSPPSPPHQPVSPPLPPMPRHEVQEAKPSLVQPSRSILKNDGPPKSKDEYDQNAHQKSVLTLSEKIPKPPQLLSPPKKVQESKPISVPSPWYDPSKLRHEQEKSAHQKNVQVFSNKTLMLPQPMSPPKEDQKSKSNPVSSPRSILKDVASKSRNEHDKSAHQKSVQVLSEKKTHVPPRLLSPPKEVQEAKLNAGQFPRSILKQDDAHKSRKEHESAHHKNMEKNPSIHQQLPISKEVQEGKSRLVPSPSMLKHEPHKVREKHGSVHQKNVFMLSDKTNPGHEPHKEQHQHKSEDVIMQRRGIIHKPKEEHQQQQQPKFDDVNMGKQGIIHEPKEEHHQQQPEFDDIIMSGIPSVIQISGGNKGAMMEILGSSNKIHGAEKERRLDEEEEKKSKSKSKSKLKKYHGNNDGNHFVNSNVQIVNGSIVYNSTQTHYDPGVHLSLCRKPSSDDGFIIKEHGINGYTSSIN